MTKRFHNNVNSKTLKSIEEIATAVAIVHNLVRIGRGKVIPLDNTSCVIRKELWSRMRTMVWVKPILLCQIDESV